VAERNLLGVLKKVGSDAGGRVIEARRRCHRAVEIIGVPASSASKEGQEDS
jgi:hypothetical protein